MQVRRLSHDAIPSDLPPGATYRDLWEVDPVASVSTARMPVERIFGEMPGWAAALLRLRDQAVRLVGLRAAARRDKEGRMLPFPVVSESADRVVMGFDGGHFDFRIIVEKHDARRFTLSTLVRTRTLFGRLYLMIVLPFHDIIVRASLWKLDS